MSLSAFIWLCIVLQLSWQTLRKRCPFTVPRHRVPRVSDSWLVKSFRDFLFLVTEQSPRQKIVLIWLVNFFIVVTELEWLLLLLALVLVFPGAWPWLLSVFSTSRELMLVVLVLSILLPWRSAKLHLFLKIELLATLHHFFFVFKFLKQLRFISELKKLRHFVRHEIDVVVSSWADSQKLWDLHVYNEDLLTSVYIARILSKVRFVKSSSIKSFRIFLKSAPWVLRPKHWLKATYFCRKFVFLLCSSGYRQVPGLTKKTTSAKRVSFYFL